MRHHDIERVATHHASRNMKYVARRALSRLLFDTKEFRLYQFESLWLIEQRNINSACIWRFGNAIFIAQVSQRTSARKVVQNRVVFHLAERNDVGRSLSLANRHNRLSRMRQFLPISPRTPATNCAGQEFVVVFKRVVLCVEKVFAVQFHHDKTVLRRHFLMRKKAHKSGKSQLRKDVFHRLRLVYFLY